MKKILMSVLSLALVVFTGFAVGCSAQALENIPVTITCLGTERNQTTNDNQTVYTFTATEEKLAEGVNVTIAIETGKAKAEDYKITVVSSAEAVVANQEIQGKYLQLKGIKGEVELTVTVSIDEAKNQDSKGNKYFTNNSTTFKISVAKKVDTPTE